MPKVLVIGAGMGGLSAAITLQSRGFSVTVLERHIDAGGKIAKTSIAGRDIDCGPTVLTMRSVLDRLFENCGRALDEHIELVPSPLLARHSWSEGETLDLFSDIEQTCEAIEQFAGKADVDNYRRFAKRSAEIYTTLDNSFMRVQRPSMLQLGLNVGVHGFGSLMRIQPLSTLWDSLGKTFNDPRLRQLFARYSTYCGSSPFKAPATLMLIAHAERSGVWLPRNGMQSVASALSELAVALGVEIRLGCGARSIDARHGVVRGVVDDNGAYHATDYVVFNGDTRALSRGLLGDAVQHCTKEHRSPSLSAITRCQVATVSGLDLAHHTVLFGNDYAQEFSCLSEHQTVCHDPTVYVCAQDRGFSHRPDTGKTSEQSAPERLFCLMNAPAVELTTQNVQEFEETLSRVLEKHNVQLTNELGSSSQQTPNDFAQRFPGSDGALYGRTTHGWRSSFTRPGAKTAIKGLYLAGACVHPGAGLPMASLSGQLAADQLCADTGHKA